MRFLALDLSVKNTGFAYWSEGMERPVSGVWHLAPGLEWAARAYKRLQANLWDLHEVAAIDRIVYEDSLPQSALQGMTNRDTLKAAVGLTEHVESFAEAVGCRARFTNQSTWRRHYLGPLKRGLRTADLKAMAVERCRQLGFEPERHDEAEALGILDYMIDLEGITPPWRHQHVLVAPIQPRRAAR